MKVCAPCQETLYAYGNFSALYSPSPEAYNSATAGRGNVMDTLLFAARLTRELSPSERDFLFSLMPPYRQTRLLNARNPARQREPLCAYGLLCAALYRVLDWRALPKMALSDNGKPFFPDCPGVCFSLSHTDGAVMVGLSPEPIGVDIEKARPLRPRFLRKVTGTDDPEAFFRRWVSMEAVGKRDGAGVLRVLRGGIPSDTGCLTPDTWPGYSAGVALSPGHTLKEIFFFTV